MRQAVAVKGVLVAGVPSDQMQLLRRSKGETDSWIPFLSASFVGRRMRNGIGAVALIVVFIAALQVSARSIDMATLIRGTATRLVTN